MRTHKQSPNPDSTEPRILKMSEKQPLYVAFLWHMHQPYYRDAVTGQYMMPWVRLHAAKDYVDMVMLLDDYPGIRMTVNLVPSLLEQVNDYVEHGAVDLVWELSVPDPATLNEKQKCLILENFFHAQFDNMIRPFPRYRELYDRRGWARSHEELRQVVRLYSNQAFRDLQVWYNLVWIDPLFRRADPELNRLVQKGRGFTEKEKHYVLEKHRELMRAMVPAYRERMERGQIELTTTPFYHPILPLLCNTDLATVARPEIALPRRPFRHPEDATEQVHRALEYFEKLFGVRPRGMWPAEGSVAPDIIPILAQAGVEWIASDEEVLGKSLGTLIRRDLRGNVLNADVLYRPYWVEHDGARLKMLFRDHYLSDLIGFQYAGWDPEEAAEDFVGRLEALARSPNRGEEPWIVPVILDGENCWEHYEEDGLPFLRALYERLSDSTLVRTTCISEYLDRFGPQHSVPRLFAGSWINHDFRIWIGHEEDNRSWDYLHDVRDLVVQHIEQHRHELTEDQIREAWKRIYIAEGSDWNWWYGDDHSSGMDELFDQLYRDHLAAACLAVGLEPPAFVRIPIARAAKPRHDYGPHGFIHPTLDGRLTHFYEWQGAGHYDPALYSTAMHPGRCRLQHLFYGFDEKHFYFRIDADPTVLHPTEPSRVEVVVHLFAQNKAWRFAMELERNGHPRSYTLSASFRRKPGYGEPLAVGSKKKSKGQAVPASSNMGNGGNGTLSVQNESSEQVVPRVAVGEIIELELPFAALGLKPDDELVFYVTLEIDGREVERLPSHTQLAMYVPAEHFEYMHWTV